MAGVRGVFIVAGAVALAISGATPASAFPPYRTSDGAPATPYELGVRVGLGKLTRDGGRTEITAPLVRSSLGLPHGFEAIGQVEYSPRQNRVVDGAAGGRWAVRLSDRLAAGVETMALLPVRSEWQGVGVETLAAATWRGDGYRLHVNAGGFHDPRTGPAQSGWRASALAEWPRGHDRFGLELFARDGDRGPADLRAGVGVIHDFGRFDMRGAVHLGLSRAAPDAVASIWLTTAFPPKG